jgi:hypothetical protein
MGQPLKGGSLDRALQDWLRLISCGVAEKRRVRWSLKRGPSGLAL